MNSTMTKSLARVRAVFSLWMDSVAQAAADAIERLASPRQVSLIEGARGEFQLETSGQQTGPNGPLVAQQTAGSDLSEIRAGLAGILQDSAVAVMLHPGHFLFQPLELPNRATEFLGGIVRSQLNRLMPWNASTTAYGWSKPTETAGDRMTVMVAGTSTEVITPLRQALSEAGARSIRISVTPPKPTGGPIVIWEEKTRSRTQARRIRRALVTVITVLGISAALAVGSWGLVASKLETEQSRLVREITAVGNKAAGLRHAQLGKGKDYRRILERKQNGPSAVLVIEALSKILSDRTHLTELRIEGKKLYMTGITDNAPALIETLERSGRFAHATFFAPTTRLKNDATERFHIEATIDPITWPQS